jgi:hypothetical protein
MAAHGSALDISLWPTAERNVRPSSKNFSVKFLPKNQPLGGGRGPIAGLICTQLVLGIARLE